MSIAELLCLGLESTSGAEREREREKERKNRLIIVQLFIKTVALQSQLLTKHLGCYKLLFLF